tara:strand:+ start:1708 stop:1989 length:282 start_codon:yes stop_codon:yes gene_type:complete
MTLKEFMERLGRTDQTKLISQLKDGIEEMNMVSEINIKRIRLDITANQRYYTLPGDCTRIINIQGKNQDNQKDLYTKIPRLMGDVFEADSDGQ